MHRKRNNLAAPFAFYGWELLFSMIRRSMTKRADMIVAFIHYLITKQFSLGAVLYDTLPGHPRRLTERLPEHWNRDKLEYVVDYMYDAQHFQLRAQIQGDELVIHLEDMETLKTAAIVIEPYKYVARMSGTLFEIMPDVESLAEHINRHLLYPVLTEPDLATTPVSQSASNQAVHFANQNFESSNPVLSTVPRFQAFPSHGSSDVQHYNSAIDKKNFTRSIAK